MDTFFTTKKLQCAIHVLFTWTLRLNSCYLKKNYYDLCFNKLIICCLLIVCKIVVKFRYRVGSGIDNMVMQNMCFISNNKHAINYLIVRIGPCTKVLPSFTV